MTIRDRINQARAYLAAALAVDEPSPLHDSERFPGEEDELVTTEYEASLGQVPDQGVPGGRTPVAPANSTAQEPAPAPRRDQ